MMQSKWLLHSTSMPCILASDNQWSTSSKIKLVPSWHLSSFISRSEWPIWNAINFSFPYLVVLIQIKWGGVGEEFGPLTTCRRKHLLTWNLVCKYVLVLSTTSFYQNFLTCHIFGHMAKKYFNIFLFLTYKLKLLESWMIPLFLGIVTQKIRCWCYLNDLRSN